ncbi:Tm-1-like ATP-binding domain-containing protein [Bacillus shivajii]|uniref:Tm-1-like ATP-binding domain-containing protein n=1 Tax=Bacillus shivajii TaxID=1983719 RepID=UPI001CF96240|nr:Tm-1-like ATP-binding domain-containing protein [Bacillus shivajii]UCZ52876.1 Tm-1-like ATP-binding domain-containing protein [Bacillus shivajii]
MGKKVLVIGTLDTKKDEFLYVKDILESNNQTVLLMNTGIYDTSIPGDITSSEVAEAGGVSLQELRDKNDRGTAVATMTKGAASIVSTLLEENEISGIFGMGGTAGTTVAATAMRNAPVGLPKILVSTVASGNTRPYVGDKDITMMYSVVDIAGINGLSAEILKNAANALSGMVQGAEKGPKVESKPMIAATMFGVTTPCVTKTRELLEDQGYDVLVFHATGTGGDAMESLIQDGFIEGVVDITTTEFADRLVGGIFSAGDDRLESAGKIGIPQVVSVGALDMVNFGPPETVPEQFKDRLFYQHNPTTTLMRTTVEENKQLGKLIAEKLNKAESKTVVILPKGGVSLLDKEGQAFEGNEQREVLYASIKENLNENIPYIEVEEDINDPSVSELIVKELLQFM